MKIRDLGVCRTNWDSPTFFFLSGLAANGFSSFSQFCAHCQGLESKPLSHKKQFVRLSTHTSLWGQSFHYEVLRSQKKRIKIQPHLIFFRPLLRAKMKEGRKTCIFYSPADPNWKNVSQPHFRTDSIPDCPFPFWPVGPLGPKKLGWFMALSWAGSKIFFILSPMCRQNLESRLVSAFAL